MASENRDKLNNLFKNPPVGGVLTLPWLQQQGISQKLAWWYVHSGWLKRIANGAYCFAGQSVSPFGAIVAIQQQLQLPIHVGGKTALQLLGFVHYVSFELNKLVLFSSVPTKLPQWFKSFLQPTQAILTVADLFDETQVATTLVTRNIQGIDIVLSCPERAMMEMLHHVPQREQFEDAYLLMQNLSQTRPAVVQLLLEQCTSIKVKRLFLYLAHRCQHQWLSQITFDRIILGAGKRVIGTGGHYDPVYKISVPMIKENGE